MIGEAGDLSEVGDAEHLIRGREALQAPPDAFRGAAADARVDLVEYERADVFAAAFCSPRHTGLQREGDPRQLAAGGDFFERTRRFPEIRGHKEANGVGAAL